MNNDVELEGGTFDLKLSLPIEDLDIIAPFIFVGAGKYVLEYPDAKYRGNVDKVYQFTEGGEVHRTYISFLNGYQFGAGIDVYLIPEISLSSSYIVRRMEFDWVLPTVKNSGQLSRRLPSGGPILPPELRNILLVPIAPHLSVDRAVVLAEGSSVKITVRGENSIMSVDGQSPINVLEEDHVDICAADVTAHFVRFGDPGYFYRTLTAHMNENSLGLPR